MKVSLKWLSAYVDLVVSPEELARLLTLSTAEVEAVAHAGGDWDQVSIGEVLRIEQHPNADRLRLATVDAGRGPRTVVCGAPNLAVGQRIAFAEAGAHLVDGHTREPSVLKATRIRGVESAGMVCSERELGLSDEHEGILVLPPDAPVGVPLRDYLGDVVLDLYSWPHRPDLMAMTGIAREVAALTGQNLRLPDLVYPAEGPAAQDRLSVQIDAPDLCPRYIGALIESVTVGASPAWMQERLLAAGMRPINSVVDITNYVMLEFGQPLHAFDYDRIRERRIIVRRAEVGERLRTLDGVERVLDSRMLIIADPGGPVALAGVMGGAESEVGETTTRILLEAANFNGRAIRGTSTRLGLRSEASARFEKSIGPDVAMDAARRAVQLLVEICGGRAARGFVDAYPQPQPQLDVSLTVQRLRTVLGFDVAPTDVRRALTSLGFTVEGGPPESYRVTVPYWRTDVRVPDDVVEEVIRILGYELIPQATISGRVPEFVPQPLRELRLKLQDLFVAAGMQEVITYSLISDELLQAVNTGGQAPLRIVNPSSSEHVILRLGLRSSLLAALAANLRQRRVELRLFETARVYLPRDGDLPYEEEMALAVIAGRRPDRWGMPSDESVDFFDAKGIAEAVLSRLQVTAEFRAVEDPDLLAGQTAAIMSGEARLGVLGRVDPTIAERFDINQPVYLLELHTERLLDEIGRRRTYQSVSRYPALRQDLALLLNADTAAAEVEAIVRRGRYVTEVRPFDLYAGPQVPAGKKSLTVAVLYQAPDRTLTDSEVAQSQARILRQLEQKLGAQLRAGG